MTPVQPWPAGTVCPEPEYGDFAVALNKASYHFADDSGGEWGSANQCMARAAEIAINAAWPYWAMQRMYKEIGPLPTFDTFMGVYCKALHARRTTPDLAEAAMQAEVERLRSDVFEVLRRHDVSEQCFAEVAAATYAAVKRAALGEQP